ncbi:hypothetical protein, partial [Propionibacterium cyclohexanicum]|uniref:hypothetical protein n=1 Tax=Propionibacterium cyclohexanicum TaxID=64702 RepID=UPI001C431CCB
MTRVNEVSTIDELPQGRLTTELSIIGGEQLVSGNRLGYREWSSGFVVGGCFWYCLVGCFGGLAGLLGLVGLLVCVSVWLLFRACC